MCIEDRTYVSIACPSNQGCDPTTRLCAERVCAPGAQACIDAQTETVCAPNCLGYVSHRCEAGPCEGDRCRDAACSPGTTRCRDATTVETCNVTGTAWEGAMTCGARDVCAEGRGCISQCEAAAADPSTVGCSFFAVDMATHEEELPDAVVVLNPSASSPASVKIYSSPGGVETLLADGIEIAPLGSYTFSIPNTPTDVIDSVSLLRKGGAFRIASDIPVQAIQHAQLGAPLASPDGACLIPESALGRDYVVASYQALSAQFPSYFDVIATVDATQVTVTAGAPTTAGNGVPAMTAGESRTFVMNRYDTLRAVSSSDVSGTRITASAPVSVFGASTCAQIPVGSTACDALSEQMAPTQTWGKTYVLAHHPQRSATEPYHFRIFAADDDTVITATPAVAGLPATLAKNGFVDIVAPAANNRAVGSFVLTSSKRFAVTHYMTGATAAGGSNSQGDPLMTTVIPVEQYVNRTLAFLPETFPTSYIQIIRSTKEPVTIDGSEVPSASFYDVGAYSVADVSVASGLHVVESSAPIGVSTFGTYFYASHGEPAAMSLRPVNP